MRARKKSMVVLAVLLFVALAGLAVIKRSPKPAFLAEANLGDGRILRVEAVTFGKNHHAGRESLVIRALGPWLPNAAREFFEPSVPRNDIRLDENGLVIWVNAIHSDAKTNVDCQGIKLDLIGRDGTIFGERQPNWFGGSKFWRVGHVFRAFPRNSKTLDLRVTTWRGSNSVEMVLRNPAYHEGEQWTGNPLPQKQRSGEAEIILTKLTVSTNEASYWRSASPYWKPEFEIWWSGRKQTNGWDLEWIAEDRYGNRGEQLGTAEPVLKFKATFHPSATNVNGPVLITRLPTTEIPIESNVWWNISASVTTNQVTILGIFPAGVHTFSEGEYLTNPPVAFGAVGGGARSGWVSQSRRVTPSRRESFHGHYSDVPVIYARVSNPQSKDRIGLTLAGDDERVFLAEPEPQGSANGVVPFLLKTPPEIKSVRAELVLLPPVEAEFLINTASDEK
jgi:hypothetical protein